MTGIYHEGVADQMRRLEIAPPEHFEVDGLIHRFPEKGRHKNSCWYALHYFRLDNGHEVVVGKFGDWRSGREATVDFDMPDLSDEEKRRYAQEMKQRKAEAEKARVEKAAEAAERANAIWEKLPEVGKSDYLDKKKVKAYGLKFSRGSIVVPVINIHRQLLGLQFIQSDGAKRFLTGTAKAGAFHFIGRLLKNDEGDYKPLLFAEGYATGAALHQSLGLPVVICFDASNLVKVAKIWRERLPEIEICICGDDDPNTQGNPGRTKAIEAANAVGGSWVVPGLNGEVLHG